MPDISNIHYLADLVIFILQVSTENIRKNKSVFEDVVASVIGKPIKVVCTLTETPPQRAQVVKKKETIFTKDNDKDIIKVAEEIFGG